MSVPYTGVRAHDLLVLALEVARQVAVTPTTSRTAVISAEATFHRAAAKSAIANGCGPTVHLSALRENGQSLYP